MNASMGFKCKGLSVSDTRNSLSIYFKHLEIYTVYSSLIKKVSWWRVTITSNANKILTKSSVQHKKNILSPFYFRMATSLSQEDINFLRLAGLLLRIAPRVVRREFDHEFNPNQLQQFLSQNRAKINYLKYKKRVITQKQYDILYPRGKVFRKDYCCLQTWKI